ncbi:hypothetical protein B0A53_00764 [Rhodotorula sp. CCFEE 5036]|nr:hypothetical protein B0A53_00764 [Rhodotorula sp. CCFEE 5036]
MTSPDDTFPHNYLSTSPAHGVPGQSFLYAAPLRSPSPILLELPVPAPKSRERYASYVVLSDYDDPVALEDTRHTVEEALASQPFLRDRCTVVGHTWGESISPLLQCSPSGYDLILVADCVWDRSLHVALIRTLRALLEASSPLGATVVHFSCGFHTGRATVTDFLARAMSAGIGPKPGPGASERNGWKELSVEGEVREWNWDLALEGARGTGTKKDELAHSSAGSSMSAGLKFARDEERQEERNRWTLYGTLALVEP